MAFSAILKLLPCIGGSSAAPEENSSIRPRPRRPSNPMVIEYKPAYERAAPPPSSTDGDASGSDDAVPSEEDGARADEGDVCVPAPIADALKVEKSKHAVEAWLEQQDARLKEQQDALLKEQQQRYVHAQSDAESHTVGSHAGHGGDDATSADDDATSSEDDATTSDDDQATLLAVPLERPVRHRLTIDSLRSVARSVRGSTAMAARSVNRRFTVDPPRDFTVDPPRDFTGDSLRGSSPPEMQGPNEKAAQGPNEKAARVLDIYGTESSRVDNGIGSSRTQKGIGRSHVQKTIGSSRAHKNSFFARVFRRKANAQAGDREKKRLSLFDW